MKISQIFITGRMKRTVKITLMIAALFMLVERGYSQGKGQNADSLRLKEQKQPAAGVREQKRAGNAYGQANRNSSSLTPKQVKSSRPDMSKARGARPPVIVRPSGSGIPKGAGKPGGVGRKGGR